MPPLEAIGALVKAARLKRDLTQQRAAKAAGVSRKHWAALEAGQNVSVVFLRKVAASLDLKAIPFGQDIQATTGGGFVDVLELLAVADEFAVSAERLRAVAVNGALPPSERGDDAAAIAAFLDSKKSISNEEGARVRQALQRVASEGAHVTPDRSSSTRKRERRRGTRER